MYVMMVQSSGALSNFDIGNDETGDSISIMHVKHCCEVEEG